MGPPLTNTMLLKREENSLSARTTGMEEVDLSRHRARGSAKPWFYVQGLPLPVPYADIPDITSKLKRAPCIAGEARGAPRDIFQGP